MLGDEKLDEHGDAYETKDNSDMYLDKDGEDREMNVKIFIYCIFFVVTVLSFFLVGCSGVLKSHLGCDGVGYIPF